jgi:hypothetical protein
MSQGTQERERRSRGIWGIITPSLVVLIVAALVYVWGIRAPKFQADEDISKTYTNTEFHFEIGVPDGWDVIEAAPRDPNEKGTTWEPEVLFPPELCKVTLLEREYDMWPGEFRVTVVQVPHELTLEDWANGYTIEAVDGVDLIQEMIDTTLGGRPAVRFSIFGFDHEAIEIALMWGGNLYILSFAGANPNDPNLEIHQSQYRSLLSLFRFTKGSGEVREP